MKNLLYFLLITSVIVFCNAAAAPNFENDGSVLLPYQHLPVFNTSIQKAADYNSKHWREFTRNNGEWSVLLYNLSGKPHRAYGKPIKIEGFDYITKENVESAALAFLYTNRTSIGINPDNLRLKHASNVAGKWIVSFVQRYKDMDVLLTETELRISNDGFVFAFGVEFYDDINLNPEASISQAAAMKAAYEGLEFNEKTDRVQSAPYKAVLPVRLSNGMDFKLVYQLSVETISGGKFASYVDAHSGELVWRINETMDLQSSITCNGTIKRKDPSDPLEKTAFSDLYLNVEGTRLITDNNGRVTFDTDSGIVVNAVLEGPWVKVTRDTASKNAKAKVYVLQGNESAFDWDNSNSHPFERSLFYHTNYIHNYHKELDPELTCIDQQIKVTIDYSTQNTNAMSSGKDIIFIGAGNPSIRFVESASVLYHEWGHSLNKFLYQELGSTNGMINASCNEAHADITSAFILDDPEIGKGTFVNQPNTPNIRTCENKMIYPDSMLYESHNDGKILSGAYWDLRKLVGLEKAQFLSHFTKYGTPDDLNAGVAFLEWFLETLITDDDDMDLTNGTPNYLAILEAFNNHRIGSGFFMSTTFAHEPYKDTKDTVNPYILEFALKGLDLPGCHPENVTMYYSTDDNLTFESAECNEYENGKYRVQIPPQSPGTILNYYFSATDAPSQLVYILDAGIGILPKNFSFLVGFEQAIYDDFTNSETASKWQLTQSGDGATQGKWEWNYANRIYVQNLPYPEVQYTGGYLGTEDKCFVTGAKGTNSTYRQHMPNGKVTLISPAIDLSDLKYPVVRFQYWFYNMPRYIGEQYKSRFVVNSSSNNGKNWQHVYTTKDQTNGWEMFQFPVSKYTTPSDSFRLRFTVDAPQSNGGNNITCLVEGMIDELEIFESTGIHEISGVLPETMDIKSSMKTAPNPFRDLLTIDVEVKVSSDISLSVTNLLGYEVCKIAETYCEAGKYIFQWDGRSSSGEKLPAGLYFIKMAEGNRITTSKIIIE